MICKRCIVSGRVQGVFYRASTQRRAEELNINGYARNLKDGRVEVLACGDEVHVHQLIEWLWQGPPAAEVRAVKVEDAPLANMTAFTTA